MQLAGSERSVVMSAHSMFHITLQVLAAAFSFKEIEQAWKRNSLVYSKWLINEGYVLCVLSQNFWKIGLLSAVM